MHTRLWSKTIMWEKKMWEEMKVMKHWYVVLCLCGLCASRHWCWKVNSDEIDIHFLTSHWSAIMMPPKGKKADRGTGKAGKGKGKVVEGGVSGEKVSDQVIQRRSGTDEVGWGIDRRKRSKTHCMAHQGWPRRNRTPWMRRAKKTRQCWPHVDWVHMNGHYYSWKVSSVWQVQPVMCWQWASTEAAGVVLHQQGQSLFARPFDPSIHGQEDTFRSMLDGGQIWQEELAWGRDRGEYVCELGLFTWELLVMMSV